jgi:hypothetical protein
MVVRGSIRADWMAVSLTEKGATLFLKRTILKSKTIGVMALVADPDVLS